MGSDWLRAITRWWLARLDRRAAHMSLLEIPRDKAAAQSCLRAAVAAFERGDLGEAETEVRAALTHDLGESDAHLFLARLLSARGAMEECARCFGLAAQHATNPGPILSEAGQLLAAKGHSATALHYLRQCIAVHPTDTQAACLVGELELTSNPGAAAAAFRHALSVDPLCRRAQEGLDKIESGCPCG